MRCRFVVAGEVQGVGFRYYAVRLAQRLGVAGWVRNLPDGRVEAVGEGTPEQLEQFQAGLRRGPSMAAVRGIDRQELPAGGEELVEFQVR